MPSPCLALRAPWTLTILLALASLTAGCQDRACFRWSKNEGTCPAKSEALTFMTPTCDELLVSSVESDGDFEDDDLCCYDVTRNSDHVFACASTSTVTPDTGSVGGFSSADGAPPPEPGCLTCSVAIGEPGLDTSFLCPFSLEVFNDLLGCACKESCGMDCLDNVCAGATASSACGDCVTSQCVDQLNACANDF